MSDETSTADMLSDQLDRALGETVDHNLLRAAEQGEPLTGLQKTISELGLELALVPEASGGVGLNWTDLGGVFVTLGYHVAPLGLGETILANRILADSGLPLNDPAPALAAETLTLSDDRKTVSGTCTVLWPNAGGEVLALAQAGAKTFAVTLAVDVVGQQAVAGPDDARLARARDDLVLAA